MNPIIERLKLYCEHKGISHQSFADRIKVARQMFYKSQNLGADKIAAIAFAYRDLNMNWLFTGEGSMIKPTFSNLSRKELMDKLLEPNDHLTKEELQALYLNNIEALVNLLDEKMQELERRQASIDLTRL